MKTLKLTVFNPQGKQEHLLLPVEANGVIFGYLPENETQKSVVDLGEGKKYGDLYVEIVDLKQLPEDEASSLISNSNYAPFEQFLFEVEGELMDYLNEAALDEFQCEEVYEVEGEANELFEKLDMNKPESGPVTPLVYQAFFKKIQGFMKSEKTANLTILASDLEKAKSILIQNGINVIY